MKKALIPLMLLMILLIPQIAFSMVTEVGISGPQELVSLKEGIEKSVPARCIAKGISFDKYAKLTISITKLGDVISYDALLDTIPPRAFHKDMKDASTLSATIDEMITALFTQAAQAPSGQTPPLPQATVQGSESAIRLEFPALSIASTGDRLFVSDAKTVYEIRDKKPSPLWKAPGNNVILRIFPYGDAIVVLTKLMNDCRSFLLAGTETKERWNTAVVPLGEGLISTNLTFNPALGTPPYIWSKAKQVRGSSERIPEGLDIISAVQSDSKNPSTGNLIASYNLTGIMTICNGSSIIWTDSARVENSPQFIEDIRVERDSTGSEPVARYYLKPRIVMLGDKLVTLRNHQGSTRIVSGLNLFEFAQLLVYAPAGNDFTMSELARFTDGYCTDIAAFQGKIAALIVKDKYTYVQFLGL